MKILFTSPGRRVELIALFKKELSKYSNNFKIYGADYDELSPALYFVDKAFKLPYEINEKYVFKVLKIAKSEDISIIIPLIDPELKYFSKYRNLFEKENIFVMISKEESINVSIDKWETFLWAQKSGIRVPFTYKVSNLLLKKNIKFPIILKPRTGSASKGIFKCKGKSDLKKIFNSLSDQYIVQEYIDGDEITVDIFGTEEGVLIFESQRKRLKVRGGEIERGVTQKDKKLTEIIKILVKNFKPNGVINVQFIKNKKDGNYYLIEINARFGGGYPLSHFAGANYIELLLNMFYKKDLKFNENNYIENLFLMRYDNALYKRKEELIELD
ncbi:hypothetical protein X275_09530 [Marinitoga sp. 1197]|uniref:ATP-grasp domain-containing protein n=1 Tax=Marinitoga sp. 1197 TaxID=1428449 RepID=UPI0006414C90|nr:ATP-grasp domain-containing protein [Marinitoga sp. 1197]KLO21311.1 hypothetical protein X275_09530 [Marinitoga sp. 1197]